MSINRPQPNLRRAIEIYRTCPEIGNKEIRELFPGVGSTVLRRLKALATDLMIKRGHETFGSYSLNTADAYEAWGLDIRTMERNYKRLSNLGLVEGSE